MKKSSAILGIVVVSLSLACPSHHRAREGGYDAKELSIQVTTLRARNIALMARFDFPTVSSESLFGVAPRHSDDEFFEFMKVHFGLLDEDMHDVWGGKLEFERMDVGEEYEPSDLDPIAVTSRGPDGLKGTSDDIRAPILD